MTKDIDHKDKVIDFIQKLTKSEKLYLEKVIIWLERLKKIQNNTQIDNKKNKILDETIKQLLDILENKINNVDRPVLENYECDNYEESTPINFSKIDELNKIKKEDSSININELYCNLDKLNKNVYDHIIELFIKNYIKNDKNILKTTNDIINDINNILS